MREYKFRGQARGEWVHGSLIICEDGHCVINWVDGLRHVSTDIGVVSETVGQFTGLTDANGQEIYEGDIVKVVSYGEESFHVVKYMIDLDYPAFDLEPALDGDFNSLGYCLIDIDTKITVIGNIYDNPEMLRLCNA